MSTVLVFAPPGFRPPPHAAGVLVLAAQGAHALRHFAMLETAWANWTASSPEHWPESPGLWIFEGRLRGEPAPSSPALVPSGEAPAPDSTPEGLVPQDDVEPDGLDASDLTLEIAFERLGLIWDPARTVELQVEAKKAFRKLSMKVHPDRIPADTPAPKRARMVQRFKEITEAWRFIQKSFSLEDDDDLFGEIEQLLAMPVDELARSLPPKRQPASFLVEGALRRLTPEEAERFASTGLPWPSRSRQLLSS